MTDVRRVPPDGWAAMREVRLRALKEAPDAFGSSYEREVAFDDDVWVQRAGTSAWFLAWDGDAAVGIAAGVVSPAGEGELQLDAMWVAPSHRGLGVGELLAEAVRAWAVSAGARTLSLTVVDGNDPARRLYERLGFRGTGERTPRPRDPSRMRERLRLSLCGE